MTSILELSKFIEDTGSMSVVLESTSKKWMDDKAASMHNEVESMNSLMKKSKFTIHTVLTVNKRESNYKLRIKVRYFKDKHKHEHKKNSHRQKNNI